MEPQREAVNRILAGIESVDGLTKEILAKLQAEVAGEGRIAISQFTVSICQYAWRTGSNNPQVDRPDYERWSERIECYGIEYDAQSARVIVKGHPHPAHQGACAIMRPWFHQVATILSVDGGQFVPAGAQS